MTRLSRRALLAAATGSIGVVAISGCGDSRSKATPSGSSSTPVAALSATPPSRFHQAAVWQATCARDTDPVVSTIGVLMVTTGNGAPDGTCQVVLLDTTTGAVKWTSTAIPTPHGMPQLSVVTVHGHPWTVAVTPNGDGSSTVYTYDGWGVSTAMAATQVKTVGNASKDAVVVACSDSAVFVTQNGTPSFVLDVVSGAQTVYGNGPSGSHPIAAYSDGFLISYDQGGFAFASEGGGWEPQTPSNVPQGSQAHVLASGSGFVGAYWGTNDHGVVAVHSITTGAVLAQVDAPSYAPAGGSLFVSPDHHVVAWGGYLLNVQDGSGRTMDLGGGRLVTLDASTVYVTDAKSIPAQVISGLVNSAGGASASASTTPQQSGSPSTPEGFSGNFWVDQVSGAASPCGIVPFAMPTNTLGLFVENTDTARKISAVEWS